MIFLLGISLLKFDHYKIWLMLSFSDSDFFCKNLAIDDFAKMLIRFGYKNWVLGTSNGHHTNLKHAHFTRTRETKDINKPRRPQVVSAPLSIVPHLLVIAFILTTVLLFIICCDL